MRRLDRWKKTLLLALAVASCEWMGAQTATILPAPVEMTMQEGYFRLMDGMTICAEKDELYPVADYFAEAMKEMSGVTLKQVDTDGKKADIRLKISKDLSPEAYRLTVDADGVSVEAGGPAGAFYALQSVRLAIQPQDKTGIPRMYVADQPRFGYRGLMVDVSRYFVEKEELMKIIDCMSVLKLNKLHLHLTDDNGWRLEIKKYPRLTSVGAWRVNQTDRPFPDRRNPEPGEPTPIGGYYTQEDMKEIIRYAAGRCIEIIPEIDMPGHSNAALAAYPELACPSVDKHICVVPGMGQGSGNIIFCAGNEETFRFLEGVIDEVAELFPSHYIHLGGDEAWKEYWKKCPRCADRMKQEGITHIEELQSYFMRRMSKYVQSKGKQVMGWDELTNSTLPDGAIIFGWQGMGNAALKAAAQGHRFVMTPARLMYLIRYQGPQWFEPLTYFGNNTLKDVYSYEPVGADWKENYESLLMGLQASMWTEFCNSAEDVTYQVFPRLAALAEVAWSPKGHKDWYRFVKSLDNYLYLLRSKGIRYSEAMFNIQHKAVAENGKVKVTLECERPDVAIRYTTDGMEPDISSPVYTAPLIVDHGGEIRCATFDGTGKMGKTLTLDMGWNLATGKEVISPNVSDKLLTNGVRGSLKQSDFEWTEWYTPEDASFTVDLGKASPVSRVVLGCLTHYAMGVHKPAGITVEVSADGQHFTKAASRTFTKQEIFKEGNFIEDLSFQITGGKSVRYVKVTTTDAGMCPEDHLKPGQQSRYRFDEIQVF